MHKRKLTKGANSSLDDFKAATTTEATQAVDFEFASTETQQQQHTVAPHLGLSQIFSLKLVKIWP